MKGLCMEFHNNGVLWCKCFYNNDEELIGDYIEYSKTLKIIVREYYKNNKIIY